MAKVDRTLCQQVMKAGVLLIVSLGLGGCWEQRYLEKPYEEFQQVGLLGHGEGLLGELRVNYWGLPRRCDSCHAVSESIHPNLGSCNRCHQAHPSGWKESVAAPYHTESLPLVNRRYHFRLDCSKCHGDLSSPQKYKEVTCISCHSHRKSKINEAHVLLPEFRLKRDFSDKRCVTCHAVTGSKYEKYYDLETHEYNF